jgi:hypothetical protein
MSLCLSGRRCAKQGLPANRQAVSQTALARGAGIVPLTAGLRLMQFGVIGHIVPFGGYGQECGAQGFRFRLMGQSSRRGGMVAVSCSIHPFLKS